MEEGKKMMRNLSVEIWGVSAEQNPSNVTVSTGDGERVLLNGVHKEVTVKADDLIAIGRMLEGMRATKPVG